ncbi:hypothetical protein L7F22_005902 [Adiantum nelumboides]|nr:hypothetical protein [Adiantum nelumboides]
MPHNGPKRVGQTGLTLVPTRSSISKAILVSRNQMKFEWEMESAAGCESGGCIRSWLAVGACVVMAVLYVGLLYVPCLLLRLPPPASLRHHILRRFAGAIAATCLSLGLSYRLLLSIKIDSSEGKSLAFWLDAFGVRSHHWIQAIIIPLLLTSFLYLGPLTMVALDVFKDWQEGYLDQFNSGGGQSLQYRIHGFLYNMKLMAFDVLAWRNFVMVSLLLLSKL